MPRRFAQRPVQRLAQRQGAVLDGVVFVDAEITLAFELQAETAVGRSWSSI